MSCAKCGGDHETTACPHGWLTNDPSAIRQPTPVGAPFRTPAPQADPLIGLQVGNYRILRMLGTGGMGSVYLGEHTGIGSKVAASPPSRR
jgi:serine/threonine-protein kinase